MNNISSLKQLKLVQRPNQKQEKKSFTPIRSDQLHEKIMELRNPSPESALKLKNTINMYERIKRSLTPIKSLMSTPEPNYSNVSHKKLKPFGAEITKISLKEYGVGDEYIKTLSATVKDLNNLNEINVRSNKIEDEGAFTLLSSLNKVNIKVIDLSNNVIGKKSIHALVEILGNFASNLEKLSLENTRLSLGNFQKVVAGLRYNHSVKELNLANNKLGIGSGVLLKELLSQTTTLKKIDLHWNLIRGQEAVKLIEGLINNDTLIAVDISWNSIGNDANTVQMLCNYLSQDSQLSHFDISHNRFSFFSCQSISDAIKSNHSLIGLHIEGNNCKIDHFGYLFPIHEIKVSPTLQKSARIIRTPGRINDNNCWICNKYTDFEVKWNPEMVQWNRKLKNIANLCNRKVREPVFVHFEIDDFLPFMLHSNGEAIYTAKRAVPSGKPLRFFFTFRGHAQISNEYFVEYIEEPIHKCFELSDGTLKEVNVSILNHICIDLSELTCKPRPVLEKYTAEVLEISSAESEWSIEKSRFAGFVWDSEDILNDCFEFDWKNSKIHRIIKSDSIRDIVKELVRKFYKAIRKTYKFYSAIGTNGNIFSINLATLTDLCQKCEIFDKNFKISDVDLALKASKYSLNQINTAYGLVRHEFLEFLVRISLDKYFRSAIFKTEFEAVSYFFEHHFNKFIFVYDQDKWRWERFFNQECDEVISENRELIQVMFNVFSGKKAKPGEKKIMRLEDFISFCGNNRLMNENFNLRHATICFHMALMTHIDELNTNCHMEASKSEFLEALARVVDYNSSKDPEKDMVESVYSEIPLDTKLSLAFKSLAHYMGQKKNSARHTII